VARRRRIIKQEGATWHESVKRFSEKRVKWLCLNSARGPIENATEEIYSWEFVGETLICAAEGSHDLGPSKIKHLEWTADEGWKVVREIDLHTPVNHFKCLSTEAMVLNTRYGWGNEFMAYDLSTGRASTFVSWNQPPLLLKTFGDLCVCVVTNCATIWDVSKKDLLASCTYEGTAHVCSS
jgi:hypothetical protein